MEIDKRPDLQVVTPANKPNVPAQNALAPASVPMEPKIGAEQLQEFTKILEEYKAGKVQTEQRILASENWWKLRNSIEEQKDSKAAGDDGFKAVSGWLHNVIVSKHADAMKAYPEPNILPREQGDKGEAMMLSAIIPCVLEQNNFEATYSNAMWQKLKKILLHGYQRLRRKISDQTLIMYILLLITQFTVQLTTMYQKLEIFL